MNYYIAVLTMMLGWGTWAFLEKIAVKEASPILVMIVNSLFFLVISPIILFLNKNNNQELVITKNQIIVTCLATLFSTIASITFMVSLKKYETSKVVMITAAYPAITLVLSFIFLGEKITVSKLFGMILILSGIVAMR